jgi:xylulokinase
MKNRRLSLGLDISTQSISAIVLDIDTYTVVHKHSLDYCKDARLNLFGLRREDYILPPESAGEASQPTELYFCALDAMLEDLKEATILKDVVVINNSGQQHGHVYLNHQAQSVFGLLTREGAEKSSLPALLKDSLSYSRAPIWMTANTREQAKHIREYVGGKERAIVLSGSDVPLRFTGIIIRKIAQTHPEIYEKTENIQLISSLIPAILTGNSKAPIDYGNGCGTSLMDYTQKRWSDTLIRAAADGLPGGEKGLREKLPSLVAPDTIVGTIKPYFVRKYGFSPSCKIAAGSGDNPQSKAPVTGDLLSLGTSFVNMVSTDGKTLDMNGYANAMYDGIGRPFIFGCRTNGAAVWDRLRAEYGLKKEEYAPAEAALRQTPVARYFLFWQPRNESFPPSGPIDMVRLNKETQTLDADYAGLIETTLASVYIHSKSFTRNTHETLYVTGGAGKSPEVIRRVAAIWNRPVTPVEAGGAALGAAVTGAYAYLKAAKDKTAAEQFIHADLLKREKPVHPIAEDVLAFHRSGGYLDILAAEETKLVKQSPT